MAWQATLDTVARDVGTGEVTLSLTISDGVESHPLVLVYPQDDPEMTPVKVRQRVLDDVLAKGEFKTNYTAIQGVEGSTFP